MNIQTEIQDDHQAKLTVEVDADQFESAKRRAAKKIANRVKVPGFRPGKAPYNVVLKQVGEAAIVEDALDILLEEIYPQALDQAEIDPYGPGQLENMSKLDPPTFEILVPLAPEIELGDFRSIQIPYESPETTEEDVNKAIENLRDQQAVLEPADRPVEEGDLVYLTLSAKRVEPKNGEDSTLIPEQRVPIVVEPEGEQDENEWPFPGFSRMLIGGSPQNTNASTYDFPDDYHLENLKGASAEFSYEIEEIKSRSLPEVTDEFAQSVGDFENLEALREKLLESLRERMESDYRAEYDQRVVDELIESSKIKYPPQLLEEDIDAQVSNLERQLSSRGMDLETYLKTRSIDLEALREEIKPQSEERVQRSLALMEVAKEEKIEISTSEVEEEADETLSSIRSMLDTRQAHRYLTDDYVSNLKNRIIGDKMFHGAIERLRKIASGSLEDDDEPETEPRGLSTDETPKEEKEDIEISVEDAEEEDVKSESEITAAESSDESASEDTDHVESSSESQTDKTDE